MKKLLLLALAGLFLSGCSVFSPHKMDVQQGNIFTEAQIKRLHKGMSKSQVRAVMGTPVSMNIFNNNQVDYVYTNQPGHQKITIKRVVCTFRDGELVDIQQS